LVVDVTIRNQAVLADVFGPETEAHLLWQCVKRNELQPCCEQVTVGIFNPA